MKKIKLTIAGLLLAGLSYSQAQDTICHSFAGKIHFEFDYYESEIINRDTSVFLKDNEVKINKNEFLVVDLYDNCGCVVNNNFIKERKIVVYFRNGEIKTYKNPSGDDVLYFDGLEIKKVIIKKPNLKVTKSKSSRS
mgnify:FL=1|tara:strand:+ start:696 stop:1106 length:411 start_codon:yes stop_codon:yes gene_type:complete